MRALLTPEIAHRMGVVLFRPGAELMPLFMRGRVLLEPEPESMASYDTGPVPAAVQPLADDPVMSGIFENQRVIQRAGGLSSLDGWLNKSSNASGPIQHGTTRISRSCAISLVASGCAGTAITPSLVNTRNSLQV